MTQIDFHIDQQNYFQVKLLEDFGIGSDCIVFFKNDAKGLDLHITQCSLGEILSMFESIYNEIIDDQRNIFSPLFKRGLTYYYLIDSYLIQSKIKVPCNWTKYLETLSIFTHYYFCWIYKHNNKTYFELGFGTNLLENEQLPQPLEGAMLVQMEIEQSKLQALEEKVNTVRALM